MGGWVPKVSVANFNAATGVRMEQNLNVIGFRNDWASRKSSMEFPVSFYLLWSSPPECAEKNSRGRNLGSAPWSRSFDEKQMSAGQIVRTHSVKRRKECGR